METPTSWLSVARAPCPATSATRSRTCSSSDADVSTASPSGGAVLITTATCPRTSRSGGRSHVVRSLASPESPVGRGLSAHNAGEESGGLRPCERTRSSCSQRRWQGAGLTGSRQLELDAESSRPSRSEEFKRAILFGGNGVSHRGRAQAAREAGPSRSSASAESTATRPPLASPSAWPVSCPSAARQTATPGRRTSTCTSRPGRTSRTPWQQAPQRPTTTASSC